jgi:hypothetical protein
VGDEGPDRVLADRLAELWVGELDIIRVKIVRADVAGISVTEELADYFAPVRRRR